MYFKTVVRRIEFCNVQTIFVSRTMCGLVLNVKVFRTVRLWCHVFAPRAQVYTRCWFRSRRVRNFFLQKKKNKNRSNVFFRPLIFFALTHRRTFGNRKKTKLFHSRGCCRFRFFSSTRVRTHAVAVPSVPFQQNVLLPAPLPV